MSIANSRTSMPSRSALKVSPVQFQGCVERAKKRLFQGRAIMYGDKVVLHKKCWRKPSRHVIPLNQIVWIHWIPRPRHGANLRLHLRDGTIWRLRIRGAGWWKYTLQELCACLGNESPLQRRWKGMSQKLPPDRASVAHHTPVASSTTTLPQAHVNPSSTPSMKVIVNAEIALWLSGMGYAVTHASPQEVLGMLATEAAKWGLTAEQLAHIIQHGQASHAWRSDLPERGGQ